MSHKARAQWNRYKYCRDNGHEQYVVAAKEAEGFFDGDGQWALRDRQILANQNRPCETVNNVLPRINNIVGHQIENQAEVTYE